MPLDGSAPIRLENDVQMRWSIAFAAALMNALQSGGFFFTPTTLMPKIVADFSIPMSLSTVPIAVGKIAYVLLLIPGGIMVDQYGPRLCVLGGIFGLAVIITLYAMFVSSFSVLLAAHVALATVASVSGVPVYSLFIAQWFEGGIGLAMGLVLAGYSAAGTAVPMLLGPIAATFGWRAAMGCICGLLWVVGLPVAYFFLHELHPEDEGGDEEEPSELVLDEVVEGERTLLVGREAPERDAPVISDTGLVDHKSWTFVGFAFSYILLQYCFGCFGENIMFFLTIDRGMSLALASLFFSALNFASFTAKLIGGHLGDRFDRFHVASASSAIAALGIVFLFLGSSGLDENNIPHLTSHPLAVLTFTVLFGFGYGATFNCLYALTPIVFGKQNLGRTQSTLFGLGLAGNAVGSVLTGVLRSNYDTYQRPFLVAAMACTANFFVFNVTRMTLGGSVEGFKALDAETGSLQLSGTFAGMEELLSAEDAVRGRRGGVGSEAASPRMSPAGSCWNVRGGGFFGATFAPLPSLPEALSSSPSMSRGLHAGGSPLVGIPTSISFGGTSQSGRPEGTGMQVEQGFPIVRDWSGGSLRSYLPAQRGTQARRSPVAVPRRRRTRLKKSSTMEAIIESGILSASLESAGYLGNMPVAVTRSPSPGQSTRSPSATSPSPTVSYQSIASPTNRPHA